MSILSQVSSHSNPFAYVTIPPVGRLLDCLCTRLRVGGCFRPGNRQLADWLGYASAGQMPYLLSELASEGWIDYDPTTRLITLLRDYRIDRAIGSTDQGDQAIGSADQEPDDSALIHPIDRDFGQTDAEYESDQYDRSHPQRMEDHVLVAAAESHESAAAKYNNIPCSPDLIDPTDRSIALFLTELGADAVIVADTLAVRPALTPHQVRATYDHFAPRIKAGYCTVGAFFKAIRHGQLHAAPPDPAADWHARAVAQEAERASQKPAVSSQQPAAPPDDDPDPPGETLHQAARRLLPDGASGHDFQFLWQQLASGATDAQALAALAARGKRGGR